MLQTRWMLWSDIAVPSPSEGCGCIRGAKKITGIFETPQIKVISMLGCKFKLKRDVSEKM